MGLDAVADVRVDQPALTLFARVIKVEEQRNPP